MYMYISHRVDEYKGPQCVSIILYICTRPGQASLYVSSFFLTEGPLVSFLPVTHETEAEKVDFTWKRCLLVPPVEFVC